MEQLKGYVCNITNFVFALNLIHKVENFPLIS